MEIPNIGAFIVQGGALAILGYHLLFGLPRMLKSLNENMIDVAHIFQQTATTERETFEKRASAIASEIAFLRRGLPALCKAPKGHNETPASG